MFPTLLTVFVSPEWKRLRFEPYFEMQAGNFIALAGYFMVIGAIFAFGAHLLRRVIGLVARLAQRWHRPSDQEKSPECSDGRRSRAYPALLLKSPSNVFGIGDHHAGKAGGKNNELWRA